MTDFELNTVIVSILIAFALTGILSCWGQLVEARRRVVHPTLSIAASGWIFLSLIAHWLDVSAFRHLEFDRNYESLLFFLPSILGAAAAFVLTPTVPGEGELDLEKHYFSVSPWSYRLAGAYVVLAGVADLLIPGEASTPRPFVFMLTALLLGLSFTERPGFHRIGLVLLWMIHIVKFSVGTR